jgi:hypothetical protein
MWIYQANFCVDCGMAFLPLVKRRWWPRSYFCKGCRKRLKSIVYLRYGLILLLVALAVGEKNTFPQGLLR